MLVTRYTVTTRGQKTDWSFSPGLFLNRLGAGAAGTFLPQPPTSLRATWPGRPLVWPPASISLGKRGAVACLRRRSLPRAGTLQLRARRARDHRELRSKVALSPTTAGLEGARGPLGARAVGPRLPSRSYLKNRSPGRSGLRPAAQAVRPPAPPCSSRSPWRARFGEDSRGQRHRAEAARPLLAGGGAGGATGFPPSFQLVDFFLTLKHQKVSSTILSCKLLLLCLLLFPVFFPQVQFYTQLFESSR